MLALYLSLGLHAIGWTILALFAIRLIGWHRRGYRLLLLGLGLDLLALSAWHFPEVARHIGLPVWNTLLDPLGLGPGTVRLTLLAFVAGTLLEWAAVGVCVWVFFDACRAAEELRYVRRSVSDRETVETGAGHHDRGFDKAKPNPR